MIKLVPFNNARLKLINASPTLEVHTNGSFFCISCGHNYLKVIIDEFVVKICKPQRAFEITH